MLQPAVPYPTPVPDDDDDCIVWTSSTLRQNEEGSKNVSGRYDHRSNGASELRATKASMVISPTKRIMISDEVAEGRPRDVATQTQCSQDDKVDDNMTAQQQRHGRTLPRSKSGPMTVTSPSKVQKRSSLKKTSLSNNIENDGEHQHQPPNKTPIPRSKSVEFNTRVRVRKVRSLKTLDNAKDLWLQEHELLRMRAQCKEDVEQYQRHCEATSSHNEEWTDKDKKVTSCPKAIPSDKPRTIGTTTARICLRGLEKFIDPNPMRNRRINGWDAVLMEQAEQMDIGGRLIDEEVIARCYERMSLEASHVARQRAQQDALDATEWSMVQRR